MINHNEQMEFINKFDTSVYLVPSRKRNLYIRNEYPTKINHNINNSIIVDNLYEEGDSYIYIHKEYTPTILGIFPESYIRIPKNEYVASEYLDFIEIQINDTITYFITIQPTQISYVENYVDIYITPLLDIYGIISNLGYLNISILNCSELEILEVNGGDITVNQTEGISFKYYNHSNFGKIIMNSIGCPLECTSLYLTPDSLTNSYIYNNLGEIYNHTFKIGYLELLYNTFPTVIGKTNILQRIKAQTEPSNMLIISKNGQSLKNDNKEYTFDKYIGFETPIVQFQDIIPVYDFPVRDDYYTQTEKEILMNNCYNEIVDTISYEDNSTTIESKAFTNAKQTIKISNRLNITISLNSATDNFDVVPYKIFLIKDDYILPETTL
jgi:hypothetical protein